MSEETPEIEETEEKPKRPRRRKASVDPAAAEAPSSTESAQAETTSAAEPEREPERAAKRKRRTRVARDEEEVPAAEAESEPRPEEATAPEAVEDSAATVAPQTEGEQEPETAEEPVAEEPEESEEPETAEEPEATEEPERPARRRRPAAAPTPRRGRRRREMPDITVRAQAKYVRSSARKARLVCDHIRGKSVEEARAILAHTPRAIARDWSKLLESAVANAEHNHELIGEDLYVKAVHADEGPTIKRYRPRALGRATRIRKRTSHLTILLKPKQH